MIADTTFLIDLNKEQQTRVLGRASVFFHKMRSFSPSTTAISAGEFATGFRSPVEARIFLAAWKIHDLTSEVAMTAAGIDRELIKAGVRLGENDTWIAGFARYMNAPLISCDKAFDRVPGLRRLSY